MNSFNFSMCQIPVKLKKKNFVYIPFIFSCFDEKLPIILWMCKVKLQKFLKTLYYEQQQKVRKTFKTFKLTRQNFAEQKPWQQVSVQGIFLICSTHRILTFAAKSNAGNFSISLQVTTEQSSEQSHCRGHSYTSVANENNITRVSKMQSFAQIMSKSKRLKMYTTPIKSRTKKNSVGLCYVTIKFDCSP